MKYRIIPVGTSCFQVQRLAFMRWVDQVSGFHGTYGEAKTHVFHLMTPPSYYET